MRGYARFLFTFIISILTLPGCGVESLDDSGSPHTVTFSGQVLRSDGQSADGITITYMLSGDIVTTDARGHFALGPVLYHSTPNFLLGSDEFSLSVSVDLSGYDTSPAITISFLVAKDLLSAQSFLPPQATPTAVPPDTQSPYDNNGDTASFDIPQGLIGNAHRGKRFYFSNCITCHNTVRGRGYSYDRIKKTLSQPPMNTLKIRSQDIADLTAYLNFR